MSESGQTQKSESATAKSALPSTTGVVSQTCQVRKVPDSDISRSLDHLIGEREEVVRDIHAERPGVRQAASQCRRQEPWTRLPS
jgi:hypothetical protein